MGCDCKWESVQTMPKSGEFLIGVWEGGWRNPRQRFRVYEAIGFTSGPVWGQQYRTVEGDAYEIVGWMKKPLPPVDVSDVPATQTVAPLDTSEKRGEE